MFKKVRRRCQRLSGQGHAALLLIGCLHVIVERSNHTVQIQEGGGGASDLQEDVEKPITANQVK